MNKLFTKIAALVLGMTMAVGVGVAVGGKEIKQANAGDPGSSIYNSGTPSWGTAYSYGEKTLNDVAWYFTNYGNNSSMGWNKASGEQSGQVFGPLTNIEETKAIGAYQTSGAFSKAQKITVTVLNADSVTGTWYVWYSTDLGSNWTKATTGDLAASTSSFTYDHGSKIGNSVYFAFGYGTEKTTKTRINLVDIEIWEEASKTLSSISLGGNYQNMFTVGDTFAHTGMTVTANYDDDSTADVTGSATWSSPDMSSAGQKTVTVSYTEGGTTKTADYTITVNESTAPTILLNSNSFTGYTGQSFSVTATYSNLTSAFAWSTSGSGTTTETITSTGTETNGTSTYSGTLTGEGTKVLTATGGGVAEQARPTFTITITQTLRPVKAPTPGEKVTSTLTFEAACGGSGTSDGGEKWTVTSDGTESTYDATKGIHYGTGSAAVKYIKLTSTDFTSGKITKVVANASTASGVSATVSVKVGDSAFGGAAQSITSSAAEYTFNGDVDASKIEVLITKPSSAVKAIYCKSIAVTYETEGKLVNIANIAGHEAEQYAVVRFAKRFNAIMDGTNNCTTGLSDAWSAIKLVYDKPSAQTEAEKGFLQDIASLSSAEQDYAKKLIKYATAQWTKDTDENYEYCLERAVATYEYCVKNHDCSKFMDSVRPVERTHVNPISIFGSTENTNAIAIVVIVSVVSLTAIGGYFFLRKKREQN